MTYPSGGAPYPQFPPHAGQAPQRKKSSVAPVVIIVSVVAVLLCCGGGGVAALFLFAANKEKKAARSIASTSSSRHSYSSYSSYSPYSSTYSPPVPQYNVGDCFQLTDSETTPVACGDGTYQIYKIAGSKSSCGDQGSIEQGSQVYCLKVDLRVHYCYTIPAKGWIQPAPTCKAPGTILVFDVIPDTTNGNHCQAASNGSRYRYWYWQEPAQVVCAYAY
ncbi:hypothetical protein [Segniliparus rugosus]|uniref:Uncharacterized protein n=1 Tax=Segniliparus rugosus (strain ATCC BAA-974 / DSM 45345 / CCUG 50838 / CIP 108380 / JCM 13579 / CDC 945) TaxID=679197 RepID=E5XNX4_SEGRC|nr:hypothetical protein [Segniliparus rugosus]EFV13943.1 hypothetical protein HMPREF9336_01195 [Segniliparus rugosus ATCC BAA-974]